MRAILITVSALVLTGCTNGVQDETPPPFPVNQASGEMCGGMMGVVCSNKTDYCHMTIEAQCGAADQMGACKPKPEMCTMDYNPVCGCDGKTYSNECVANSKGVSAAYEGECRE